MKFASLLAQFLYTHKRLDLPGIGSFLLDSSAVVDTDNARSAKPALLEGVSFEHNASVKQSPELIEFIAAQTGKIKALAAADLDSHLELAKQFLNIGKPFLFEGIGSLSKMQAGGFSFAPGQLITEKVRETPLREAQIATTEEPASDYRSILYAKKVKANWKKPLVVFLLLAGIVLALWGGYTVYKRTTAKNKTEKKNDNPEDKTVLVPDTTANNPGNTANAQTNTVQAPPAILPSGNYKFVVETANRVRALSRYSKLKGFGLDIRMETADSATFKLYFILPAAAADTARIVDSLRKIYTPAGNRAYIDN